LRPVRVAALASAALVAAGAATAAPGRVDKTPAGGCNGRLNGLRTLSDPQRKLVDLHPKDTTITAINALARPHRTPSRRSTGFTRRVWRVIGQITEFELEDDDSIQLVLFDHGSYLIAEMPAAQCIPKTARDRKAIVAARKKFTTRCGRPTRKRQPLGAVVVLSGVGFFGIPHAQKPRATNFAELSPVTGINFIVGCGA
jgi:hypothetical protein